MSLLFDENLSPRLIRLLEAAFPQSEHVERVGLKGQSDLELWEYAARHGATLVSKDNDFRQLSFLRGHPPKVIWLSVGNAGTDAIAELLAMDRDRVQAFLSDPEASLCGLGGGGQVLQYDILTTVAGRQTVGRRKGVSERRARRCRGVVRFA